METVLELIQKFCRRTGLPSPSLVVDNSDSKVVQLFALLNEVAEDLVRRPYQWQLLQREASFVTVAGEDQGLLNVLAPLGLRNIVEDTIYNRTMNQKFYGPVSAPGWQASKSARVNGLPYGYRIREGKLFLQPAATAGQECFFEYGSLYSFRGTDGVTYKLEATADTDTPLLPAHLLSAGLRWKWRYEKGLDYIEEFEAYELYVQQEIAWDGTKPTLSLEGGAKELIPGIFVPRWVSNA